MKKQVLFALLTIGLCSPLFVACQKHKDEATPTGGGVNAAGYFVISSVERTTAPSGRTAAGETVRFDLGTLKASKEFLFMVANGGDEAIFDVSLTTDKPAFEIFPGKIQLVPGRKGSAIIPLLTVGITHGVNLNGIGNALTLPKGENTATITMSGKTLSGKDTVAVEGKFVVAVDAKVVDAQILSGESVVAPTKNSWGTVQWLVEPARTVKLVNTGNVTIQATIIYSITDYIVGQGPTNYRTITNVIEVQPNEAKDITGLISKPLTVFTGGTILDTYSGTTTIDIKDQGIIYNINKFTLISR